MKLGTRSILFGAHCWFIHPFFVAWAWKRLYGFPFDPRLWAAFFLHDLGYIGKYAMDSEQGELHPHLGANIMHALFDWTWIYSWTTTNPFNWPNDWQYIRSHETVRAYLIKFRQKIWHDFTLFHSRHLAKRYNKPVSRLCFADKLASVLTPSWLYLPMVTATGEIKEYMAETLKRYNEAPQKASEEMKAMASGDKHAWHAGFKKYMTKWIELHKDGKEDEWTPNRYGKVA